MSNSEPRRGETPNLLTVALRYSALGMQMAFSVLVGFGVGYLLDLELHTRPWLTVVFAFLGMGAAFYSVYRAVRDLERSDKNASKE